MYWMKIYFLKEIYTLELLIFSITYLNKWKLATVFKMPETNIIERYFVFKNLNKNSKAWALSRIDVYNELIRQPWH